VKCFLICGPSSSVSIVTTLRTGKLENPDSICGGVKGGNFVSHCIHACCAANPVSYSRDTGALNPRVKRPEHDILHWPQYFAADWQRLELYSHKKVKDHSGLLYQALTFGFASPDPLRTWTLESFWKCTPWTGTQTTVKTQRPNILCHCKNMQFLTRLIV
jgi:hypothetical protein